MEDKMVTERVDLRGLRTTDVIRTEELISRKKAFVNNGFDRDWIETLGRQKPTLYSPSVLTDHMEGLEKRGFANPKKMIESLPAILGYAFENIDRRLKFLKRAINLYGLSLEAPFLMENIPFLFSSKVDKILVLARIIKFYNLKRIEINTRLIQKLLSANLEDVLVALSSKQNETIEDLIKSARRFKNEGLSRDKKRQIISEDLMDMEKIKRRYFKGYPEK